MCARMLTHTHNIEHILDPQLVSQEAIKIAVSSPECFLNQFQFLIKL